jgi:hypothetical protein
MASLKLEGRSDSGSVSTSQLVLSIEILARLHLRRREHVLFPADASRFRKCAKNAQIPEPLRIWCEPDNPSQMGHK